MDKWHAGKILQLTEAGLTYGMWVITTATAAAESEGAVGKHATVTDADLIGSTDADAGADHAEVPDMDKAFSRALRPDRNPNLFV